MSYIASSTSFARITAEKPYDKPPFHLGQLIIIQI